MPIKKPFYTTGARYPKTSKVKIRGKPAAGMLKTEDPQVVRGSRPIKAKVPTVMPSRGKGAKAMARAPRGWGSKMRARQGVQGGRRAGRNTATTYLKDYTKGKKKGSKAYKAGMARNRAASKSRAGGLAKAQAGGFK